MLFINNYILSIIFIFSLVTTGLQSKTNISDDTTKIHQHYSEDIYLSKFDSLNSIYGRNKKLPKGYEIQALLALSHYPELKNTNIDFVYRKALIPLSSRPRFFSTIRKKKNWKYKVIISSKSLKAMENILVKNLPFNAQVGIIGHELAHTIYYQKINFFQVLKTGVLYFIPKFRAKFEKDTDKRTIDYGLGWQLLEYAEYVRNQPDSSYVDFDMDKYYLNPDEIKKHMNKSSIYN